MAGGGTNATAGQAGGVSRYVRAGYIWTMAVSRLGTAVSGVATAYIAYDRSRSVLITAIVTVASGLPYLLFVPLATQIVQRLGAVRVFVLEGFALAALGLVPALLAVGHHLDVVTLLLWQLAGGVVRGLAGPVVPLLVRQLSAPEPTTRFMARIGRSAAAASLVGLLLGGAIVVRVGEAWAYVLDAASFLPGTLFVAKFCRGVGKPTSSARRIRDGLTSMRRSQGLRAAFIATAVVNLLATPVISTLPALARHVDNGAQSLSILMAAYTGGGLFVAAAVKRLHQRVSWSRVSRWTFIVSGLGFSVLGLLHGTHSSHTVVLAAAALTLLPTGLAVSLDVNLLSSLVQLGVTEEDSGPVLAAYSMVATIVAPLGGLAIGGLADALTPTSAVLLSGVALLVAGVVGQSTWLFRALDELDHPQTHSAAAAIPRQPLNGVHHGLEPVAAEK